MEQVISILLAVVLSIAGYFIDRAKKKKENNGQNPVEPTARMGRPDSGRVAPTVPVPPPPVFAKPLFLPGESIAPSDPEPDADHEVSPLTEIGQEATAEATKSQDSSREESLEQWRRAIIAAEIITPRYR